MNLDELLKSVWSAETNQGIIDGPMDYSELNQLASALSLPGQLRFTKKTVDEVWQDIQQSEKIQKNGSSFRKGSQERQPTLGEMTLEDFLVKAGIVAESSPGNKNEESIASAEKNLDTHETQWINYQVPPIQQQLVVMQDHYQLQQPLPVSGNGVMDTVYPESHMTISPTPLMGALSDAHMLGQKRVAPGDVMEKTVERRQKRMIKNRESAARSRARKQAYTHELENKVSRLEEENERLRREEEVYKVLPCEPLPTPKYQLRRTSSAAF